MTAGIYGPDHQRLLLAAAAYGEQHIRITVVAARLGMTLDQGRRLASELVDIGFLDVERTKKLIYLGYTPPHGESYDEHADDGYYRWAYTDTAYGNLTDEGRDEVRGLQEDGAVASDPDLLKQEVMRLREECRGLREMLAAAAMSHPQKSCATCHNEARTGGRFCGRCGARLRVASATAPPVGFGRAAE